MDTANERRRNTGMSWHHWLLAVATLLGVVTLVRAVHIADSAPGRSHSPAQGTQVGEAPRPQPASDSLSYLPNQFQAEEAKAEAAVPIETF